MIDCDALVVGGGPAGSTCARALRLHGWTVVVMDRARFPRDKVCGGWLTPEVFSLLELDPKDYAATGLTLQEITGFRTSVSSAPPVDSRYPRIVSYAIRRCEFDEFLLRRSVARVIDGTALSTLRRDGDAWIANDGIRARVVIGAGGHFCPVARFLRGESEWPRPVVAKEAEYPLAGRATTVSADTPELFFCDDLEGYGWCVRKGDYLNVGIGRRTSADFGVHVDEFAAFLERSGKAPGASGVQWHGHAYVASGVGQRRVIGDGMLLIGDAAGLAYPESGEGIKPAIESALLAANTLVAAGDRCMKNDLEPYQSALAQRHPHAKPAWPATRPVQRALGRALLRSPAFTRHVVLDRWFLRAQGTR